MDGRTLDLWAKFEDGEIARPTMIALIDRSSFKALHFVIGKAETALLTRDLILQTCDQFGIFDNLLTDNSRAFSSLLVAGGVKHKFRNAGTRHPEWEPPGVCEHLGINLKFTKPSNPGAKIPESKFSKWSCKIDTRPEFNGAHSGPNPGEKPEGRIVPVPIELVERIYRREMHKDNAKLGRRTLNAKKGESYDQTFQRLLEGRIKQPMQPKQRWRASLLYQIRKVDRLGQVCANGWVYGNDKEDGSQETLLRYEGMPILIGTDPSNFAAAAVAFDLDTRREIMAGIQPSLAGDYEDADGARKAAKERKRLAKITHEIDAAYNKDLTDVYAELDSDTPTGVIDDPRPKNIVKPQFKDGLQKKRENITAQKSKSDDFWARQLVTPNERKASGSNR